MTFDEFIPKNRMRSCVHFVSQRSRYSARPGVVLVRGQPMMGWGAGGLAQQLGRVDQTVRAAAVGQAASRWLAQLKEVSTPHTSKSFQHFESRRVATVAESPKGTRTPQDPSFQRFTIFHKESVVTKSVASGVLKHKPNQHFEFN